MATATLSASARRDKAQAKETETRGQLATVEAQLAQIQRDGAALDARVTKAGQVTAAAGGLVDAARSTLQRAQAALQVAAGTDGEAEAQKAVQAAQKRIDQAEQTRQKAQTSAQATGEEVARQRATLEDKRKVLDAQRDELAGLASALAAHAGEADQAAAQQALQEAAQHKAALVERITSARQELASAEQDLDQFHNTQIPALLTAWPHLRQGMIEQGVGPGYWQLLDVYQHWHDYLDSLVRHTDPVPSLTASLSVGLHPDVAISLTSDHYNREALVQSITGRNGPVHLMRQMAQERINDLRKRSAEQVQMGIHHKLGGTHEQAMANPSEEMRQRQAALDEKRQGHMERMHGQREYAKRS